jgi:soluble lytic murein transglycosylase-like protein
MQIESCGDPGAVSPSGALGLFQVMGFHFPAQENALDPETNARRGLDYLQLGLNQAGGNADLAFAGYNGGHARIGQEPRLWPAETQRYVYWASGIYADAHARATSSARLSEWMSAGGARLCRRAASAVGLPY